MSFSKNVLFSVIVLVSLFLVVGISYYSFLYKKDEIPRLGITGASQPEDVASSLASANFRATNQFPEVSSVSPAADADLPEDLKFLLPKDNSIVETKKAVFDKASGYEMNFQYPGELASVYFEHGSLITGAGYKILDGIRTSDAALYVAENSEYLLKIEFSRVDETVTNIKILVNKK